MTNKTVGWAAYSSMSNSLHLDDIRDGENVVSRAFLQCTACNTAVEPADSSVRDQVKLFMRYVSACSDSDSRRNEESDSSDEFQQGRDSCAVAHGNTSSRQSAANALDSFLLKYENQPSRNSDQPVFDRSTRQCELPATIPEDTYPLHRRSLSKSWSNGSPKNSVNSGDHVMYKIQVTTALSTGKSVWL
jgi:hypothetical protein